MRGYIAISSEPSRLDPEPRLQKPFHVIMVIVMDNPALSVSIISPPYQVLEFLLLKQSYCPNQCQDDDHHGKTQGCEIAGL